MRRVETIMEKNEMKSAPMERLAYVIERTIASRKRMTKAFLLQRSQDDLDTVERLLACSGKTEEEFKRVLCPKERKSLNSVRIVTRRLRLQNFDALRHWASRARWCARNLAFWVRDRHIDPGRLARLTALADTNSFEQIAVLVAFLEVCQDFPCRTLMYELLRIASPGNLKELVQSLLTTLQALVVHEEGQSGAEDMAELQEHGDEIEILTGQIKDLKSALECAQIQICSYEKRMDSLQKKLADNVWFDALSQMNSPAMGMLLDQFAASEENLRKLRSKGVEIPREIESIPACIRMFMRAIEALGVVPIKKPGAILNITLTESESYEYSGSDFVDSAERKVVQVVTPGWIYGDRIISLPRVVEQLASSQN